MKALIVISVLFLSGCLGANIWNAGDLETWVRSEAVKSGCDEGSIDLDDWYVDENGKNNWKGRCQNSASGKAMKFSINVDEVWTPSSDK